jgi:hypothetical protein
LHGDKRFAEDPAIVGCLEGHTAHCDTEWKYVRRKRFFSDANEF